MSRRRWGLWGVFAVLLAAQVGLWSATRDLRPAGTVLPPPPSPLMRTAWALGDEEFLFRVLAVRLFAAGDLGGRMTPLAEMDYEHVAGWLHALAGLSPRSDVAPALAALYFGLTPKTEDLRPVIGVLRDVYRRAPRDNWRWMAHAVYLARHRLGDLDLALDLATELSLLPPGAAPLWTRQMPAFVLDAMGEDTAAALVMGAILDSTPDLPPAEVRFMRRFIEKKGAPVPLN